jgi:predicted AAA+ superfamily ATPase
MLEPRRFIQVISGPRQIGKTTLVKQTLNQLQLPSIYLSADGQILLISFVRGLCILSIPILKHARELKT